MTLCGSTVIRFSQMNILTVIAMQGEVQPAEVGRMLALEKSTLSRNLKIMENNGWITSAPMEAGNGVLLKLSAEGTKLFRKASTAWSQAQDQLTNVLGDQATRAIRNTVDTIVDLDTDV